MTPDQKHYPVEFGPSDNRRLECSCGNPDPAHADGNRSSKEMDYAGRLRGWIGHPACPSKSVQDDLRACADEIERLTRELAQAKAGFASLNGAHEALRQRFAKACAEITRLSGEPDSAHETSGWRPIETAPKDGRTLLLGYYNACGKWRTLRGQWFAEGSMDEWDFDEPDNNPAGWYETCVENDDPPNCWATEPTHWQPTPRPPEKADGAS